MAAKRKRYLVCPGNVISQTDGQRHFVGAHVLMALYRVDPRECIVQRHGFPAPPGLIELRPRYHGNYELCEPQEATDDKAE